MAINLKNFVKIELNYHESVSAMGSRDTCVLIDISNGSNPRFNGVVLTSYEEFTTLGGDSSNYLYPWVRTYFDNGGKKLHIINGNIETEAEEIQTWILSQIASLPNEEIIIAFAYKEAADQNTNEMNIFRAVASTMSLQDETYKGINEKILLASFSSTNSPFEDVSHENYALKYGKPGIEMTIAAYLSKINAYSPNSVLDYCYTIESLNAFQEEGDDGEMTNSCVTDDDSLVKYIIAHNYNVEGELVNQIRNIGGNTTGGRNIVNQYMKILCCQFVTDAVLQVLVTKPRYSQTSINKIMAAIISVMNVFRSNGYLSSDKIWTDQDLIYNYNGTDYTIISKNYALTDGYLIQILPLTALTAADKAANKLPPIYLIVADAYAIRQVEITGEIY